MKKKIMIFVGIISIITTIIVTYMTKSVGIIKVSLIVNDSITEKIDNESFYAGYNAYSAKEWVLNNNGLIMHEQVVIDALNMLDESDRTVISFGKPIKYFYWYKNDEVPDVHVNYKNTELKNEVYIYVTEYSGVIIDYENN